MSANLRTASELCIPDYNYYIFFKIEPNEKNVDNIKKCILQEKNKWTEGQPIQRRYKELYPDVENVMINDLSYDTAKGTYSVSGARAKELKAAKELKLNAAKLLIANMSKNKGRIYKSELLQISSSEKIKWFTIDELENSIKYLFSQGIKYIDNSQSVIDFRKYWEIDKLLVTACKESLYALLETSPNSSCTKIMEQAAKVAANNKAFTTPKGTAINKLLGIVSQVMKTPEAKKKYDDFLAVRAEVWDPLAALQSHGIKVISMDVFYRYAETIRTTLKISIDDVEILLAAGLKEFNIIIVGSEDEMLKDDKGEELDLELCPYPECNLAYRVTKKNPPKICPHCGKPLEILCWNCNKRIPYTTKSKTCTGCGCSPQSKSFFNDRIAEFERILRQPTCSIIDLKTALISLKNIVPNYQNDTNSLAYREITKYSGIIENKEKDEIALAAKYVAQYNEIMKQTAQKKYQYAMSLALNMQKTYAAFRRDNTTALMNDISAVIQKAKLYTDNAKINIAKGQSKEAIANAVNALTICCDYSEAQQILQKYPPKPVSNLRVIPSSKGIKLEWDDITQDYVTYSIIKKVGAKPNNAEDGALVETGLTIKFFEDVNIVSATQYYYAVFAGRYGTKSPITAQATPTAIFQDIYNCKQQIVDEGIKVVWNSSQTAKEVEVWKNPGNVAPSISGMGERIPADKDGFYDKKAVGTNAYLIICVYQENGKPYKTKGITVVYKPYEKLVPLNNVSYVHMGENLFFLCCDKGYNGKVEVFYSETSLHIPADTILQYINFNTICKGLKPITCNASEEGRFILDVPRSKIMYMYALVKTEQLFMVSKPYILNNMVGLRLVKTSLDGGVLSINGILNECAKSVVVKNSHFGYIENINENAENYTFSKESFNENGGIEIKLKSDIENYISVFVQFTQSGIVSYSPVIKLDPPIIYREPITVFFCTEGTVSTTKPFKVTVKFEAEKEVELPPLIFAYGYPRPLSIKSVANSESLEKLQLKRNMLSKKCTGKHVVTLPPMSVNTKFIVFLADDETNITLKELRKL